MHYTVSSLASSDFCYLLMTVANSLVTNQDRQNVGPDLDPNCLISLSDKNNKPSDDKKSIKNTSNGKCLIVLILYVSVNNISVMSGCVLLE